MVSIWSRPRRASSSPARWGKAGRLAVVALGACLVLSACLAQKSFRGPKGTYEIDQRDWDCCVHGRGEWCFRATQRAENCFGVATAYWVVGDTINELAYHRDACRYDPGTHCSGYFSAAVRAGVGIDTAAGELLGAIRRHTTLTDRISTTEVRPSLIQQVYPFYRDHDVDRDARLFLAREGCRAGQQYHCDEAQRLGAVVDREAAARAARELEASNAAALARERDRMRQVQAVVAERERDREALVAAVRDGLAQVPPAPAWAAYPAAAAGAAESPAAMAPAAQPSPPASGSTPAAAGSTRLPECSWTATPCVTIVEREIRNECGWTDQGLIVRARNDCGRPVEIKLCVHDEQRNGYSCEMSTVAPGKQISGNACKSNGHFKYWGSYDWYVGCSAPPEP